jgi:EpsI family protein
MNKKNFWISLSLLIATLVVIRTMHLGTDVVVVKKNLDRIPYTIGSMHGVDIPIEESIIKALDPDVFVFRDYISKDRKPINLYIGYYGTRKGGRSTHTPEGCYPGAGWAILKEYTITIPLDSKMGSITLNSLWANKGNERQLVYHWYQSDKSKVIATGMQQNLNRLKRRLLHNRDDGAFIRVSQVVDKDYSQTKEDMESFIKQLFPLLIEYWPEEDEIKGNE